MLLLIIQGKKDTWATSLYCHPYSKGSTPSDHVDSSTDGGRHHANVHSFLEEANKKGRFVHV
jgi:hypothetical protein